MKKVRQQKSRELAQTIEKSGVESLSGINLIVISFSFSISFVPSPLPLLPLPLPFPSPFPFPSPPPLPPLPLPALSSLPFLLLSSSLHLGADWMIAFLDSDPQPELLAKLLPAQRKAFKKFIKTQYPVNLDGFKERERALTIILLIEILEDA